jgi:hypothetical protein
MHSEQSENESSDSNLSLEQLEREAAELIQIGLEKLQKRYGTQLESILKSKTMAAWSQLENNTFGKS